MDLVIRFKTVSQYLNKSHEFQTVVIYFICPNEYKSISNCFIGIAHPTGPQKLVTLKCSVLFNLLIPQDLVKTPFLLFSSTGIHTHCAPAPRSSPKMLTTALIKAIRRTVKAGLTTSRLTLF